MKGNRWILFVAARFGSVDAKGKAAGTGILSMLGIAFGVAALIVVLSVMNGLQGGYISSIMEVSSAHARVQAPRADLEKIAAIEGVAALYPFGESQALAAGKSGRQASVLVRSVPADVLEIDTGLASALEIAGGEFDIASPYTASIGYELARRLRVSEGETFSLLAVSGSRDTDLFPQNGELCVTGTFRTGYYDIDNSFVFVSDKTGAEIFGGSGGEGGEGGEKLLAAVKLRNPYRDVDFVLAAMEAAPDAEIESWRSYNRVFFGALKVEKNALFLVSFLIFVVVTVNLYNSMRRSVYERKEDICVLSVSGALPSEIQRVFLANGLSLGFAGSALGLLCGLCISARIADVFSLAESVVTAFSVFVASLLGFEEPGAFRLFDPQYFYMDGLQAGIVFHEVLFVFVFGVFSAGFAAWLAGKKVASLKPQEILRYE